MKRALLIFLLAAVLTFALTGSVLAQSSYSFSLDEEVVNVYWNQDGTLAVDYVFTFTNDAGAHIIDYVDVGMPNSNFDLSNVTADSNGASVGTSSDFQGEGGSGFALDMGAQAIQPGARGTVHVRVNGITGMLHPDTSDSANYASGEFSPTWFGSAYVHGSTNMTVMFHLPPGVQPTEPRYHTTQGGWPCDSAPVTGMDNENRILYTWKCAANGHTQYTFGLSFPKHYVPDNAIVVPPPFDIGGLLAGLGGFFQTFCCMAVFLGMFIGAPILGAVNNNKRKLQYMPPKISIEGQGIKRGLTAVEAGILMGEPLDKIMTMILFSVVKKGAAVVETRDPLKLQITATPPDDLRDYEKDFLAAFALPDDGRRKALQDMTVKLVNATSIKMKGFSNKETVDYYKGIMERAWQQIAAAGTPEVKSEMYEQAMEWTMLDKNYDDRTRRTFTGPVFVPMWWGNYDPAYRPAGSTISAGKSVPTGTSVGGGRSTVSIPGSAFAASVVNSVQGFSSKVLGNVSSFTSNVTSKTNPVPVSTTHYSGGGGGGHSCACACACAGCACACAGGGR